MEPDNIPREVQLLAEALSRRHGTVHVARETNGLHIYMASPICLEQDGRIELQKRHLAVNAERFLGLGKFANRNLNIDRDFAGSCMKTGKAYRVSALMSWPLLNQRGIPDAPVMDVKIHNVQRCLVDDGKGNMIPPPPGQLVSLMDLPSDHAAVLYLRARDYDLVSLCRQFDCGFCVKERPEDNEAAVYYRRMPLGFNDTPQGRIVFNGDIQGIRQIWQARIIDRVDGDLKSFLHPYTNQWVTCERRDPDSGKFRPLPELASSRFEWEPSKYKTATGARRSECVVGFDAAVRWNESMGGGRKPTVVVTEGPLDAGRIGPPAVAMLGKNMSGAQAMLLAKKFRRLIYVADNDEAGKKAAMSVERAAGSMMEVVILTLPPHFKDAGEADQGFLWGMIGPLMFG